VSSLRPYATYLHRQRERWPLHEKAEKAEERCRGEGRLPASCYSSLSRLSSSASASTRPPERLSTPTTPPLFPSLFFPSPPPLPSDFPTTPTSTTKRREEHVRRFQRYLWRFWPEPAATATAAGAGRRAVWRRRSNGGRVWIECVCLSSQSSSGALLLPFEKSLKRALLTAVLSRFLRLLDQLSTPLSLPRTARVAFGASSTPAFGAAAQPAQTPAFGESRSFEAFLPSPSLCQSHSQPAMTGRNSTRVPY
jgi:hypothetical protein